AVPQGRHAGLAAGAGVLEHAQQLEEVLGVGPGRHGLAHLGVVQGQADGLALVGHQFGQRGGAVLHALPLAGRGALVRHAVGGVVRVVVALSVTLRVVLVAEGSGGPAVGALVNVADRVAGVVLVVVGEFYGEALVGALVSAAEKALDEFAGEQREPAVLGQR